MNLNSRILPTFPLLLGIAIVLAPLAPASAALLVFGGDFDSGPLDEPVTPNPFSGSWIFEFDDSVVAGTGIEVFAASLSTFNPSGDVGATTYDTSNSGAQLAYNDGKLEYLTIGGLPNGVEFAVSDTDDFYVRYFGSSNLVERILVSNASLNLIGLGTEITGSFSVTAAGVPEPGSLLLLGAVGALGVCQTCRRRWKTRQQ